MIMNFYEALSEYYDKFFLPNNNIIELAKSFNLKNKTVLDLGAGTGTTAILFHQAGFNVSALEIDPSMVNRFEEKINNKFIDIKLEEGNILDTPKYFTDVFGLIMCIGNTLPHLNSLIEVEKVISDSFNLLSESGVLLLQTVNFDKIKNEKTFELPILKSQNEQISFTRFYTIENNTITFNGVIDVNGEKLTNQVQLLLINSSDLISICKKYFSVVETYGDFKGNTYSEQSSALILKCIK
ncbi:MAG: type 11 methyltransferase [Bacillales bacterium]|jgi:SAM-dependent methyltransferase|nr:type 11 methyltransferase [Bacillales bacterium]